MIHVVLYEPEIPSNTGNIMRTCMAFGCELHLIEPLGFYMDEKHLRRAGMDYRDMVSVHIWHDWESFLEENKGAFYYLTRYGSRRPSDFDFASVTEDIYLVFGKESTGIPKEILRKDPENCIRIPMKAEARSLNLSNCVAVMVYEVLDQTGFAGLSRTEVIKGADYLFTSAGEQEGGSEK